MCHKHQVLPGAAAIKWCFGVSLSGAKQNEDRCVPEDFKVWPFRPCPWTTFGLMIVGVLLCTSAKAREAFNAFDYAQSPRCRATRWRGGSLHGGVQQLFHQGSIDGIGAVSTDGASRVNDFEYIHD
jgi:hypothetical protein